jgi:hypothetical protein
VKLKHPDSNQIVERSEEDAVLLRAVGWQEVPQPAGNDMMSSDLKGKS